MAHSVVLACGGRAPVDGSSPAATATSVPTVQGETPRQPVQQVVILHSFHQGWRYTDLQDATLRRALGPDSGQDLRIQSEYLDAIGGEDQGALQLRAEVLRARFAAKPPQLVVTTDGVAARFMASHGLRVFPGVPVVFSAVDQATSTRLRTARSATGVVEDVDPTPTIELILRLHPAVRRLVVLSDETEFGRRLRDVMARSAIPFADRVRIEHLNVSPRAAESALANVAALPSDAVLLVLSAQDYLYDDPTVSRALLSQLVHASSVPAYGLYDSYLGSGIVGGAMVSAEAQAALAGRLALRVLRGTPVDQIPVASGPMPVLVDERALRRWDVRVSALPAGTERRFHAATWWETSGRVALVALAAVLLQGALITRLVVVRRRARLLLREMRQQRAMLEHTGEIARIGGWELDVATMTPRWSAQVYAIHEIDPGVRPDLERAISFYAPEAQPIIAKAVERALNEGVRFDLELPFITARGSHRRVRAMGVPEFENGRCVRLSGIFQDLTDQHRSSEARHEALERLRSVVATMDDLVFVLDMTGRITDFYQAEDRPDLFMPPSQFLGKAAHDVLPPVVSGPVYAALDEIRGGAPSAEFEYDVDTPGGHRWFRCRVAPFTDLDGRLAGVSAVVHDATRGVLDAQRLRASEERLRQSAARLEELVNERTTMLVEREAELSAVLALLPAGLAVWRVGDGQLLDANEAFARMVGVPAGHLRDRSWWDLLSPAVRGRDRVACAGFASQGETVLPAHETELLHAEGTTIPARMHCRVVEQRGGAVMLTLAIDLRQAGEARQLFHEILQAAPDAMLVSHPDGRIIFASDELERLVGWSRAELMEMRIEDLVPESARLAHVSHRAAFMAAPRRRRMGEGRQLSVRHRDGSEIPAELSLSLVESVWQGPMVVTALRDVRERTRLELEYQRVSSALDATLTAIAFTDVEGRLTHANPAALSLWGYEDMVDVLGRHYTEFFAFPENTRPAQETILATGTFHGRATIRQRNGRTRLADFLASLLQGTDGAPIGLMATFLDVTALEDSERLRREAERVARVGSWELEHTTGKFHWSDEVFRIFELPAEEFEPTYDRLLAKVHVADRALVDQAFRMSVRERTPFDIVHRLWFIDGRVKHVRERCETTYGADGTPVRSLGTVQDVTELLSTEETLRYRNELLRGVVAAAPLVLFSTDRDGRVQLSEGQALAAVGQKAGDAVGAPAVQAFGEMPGMPEAIVRALAGESVELRTEARGHRLDAHLRPVTDRDGAIEGMVCVALDTTATAQLHEQVQQMQKMEAVGRLAGGVAHDFNNLLTVIVGHAHELVEELPRGDEHHRSAEAIEAAGERAAALTRQLLAFSRRQVLTPEVVVLRDVIADATQMIGRLIGPQFTLVTSFAPDVPPVEVDRGQVDQILMNLAINARDAMGEQGTLTIRTRYAERLPGKRSADDARRTGGWAVLEVSDTGEGMDEETRSRIFEPFFTTKAVGVGTGLGLSVVLGIVEQSGGIVEVASQPGKGATFSIWFPASAKPPAGSRRSGPTAGRATGGAETILIAEDEAPVRRLMRNALERAGYQVLEAPDGLSALGLCERFPGHIALLISDVVMPELSGPQFVARARQLRPQLRAILVTGHPLDEQIPDAGGDDVLLLRKPFPMDVLLHEVRRVLDTVPADA